MSYSTTIRIIEQSSRRGSRSLVLIITLKLKQSNNLSTHLLNGMIDASYQADTGFIECDIYVCHLIGIKGAQKAATGATTDDSSDTAWTRESDVADAKRNRFKLMFYLYKKGLSSRHSSTRMCFTKLIRTKVYMIQKKTI